jgi:FkbM family methyltransferase
MNRRLAILLYSIKYRTLGRAGFAHWLCNVFSPSCGSLARRVIESIEDAGDALLCIRLKGIEHPLFFPADQPLHGLHQALAEQCYAWNWHCYQAGPTRVQEGDVVFDCGAAEGLFALLTKDTAHHVYAFEPLPDYSRALKHTFQDADNVTIVPSAMGETPRQCWLKRGGFFTEVSEEPTDTPTEIETIDSMCKRLGTKVTYIKADIEGYEMNMLRGGAQAIREYRPRIAITTYHKAHHAGEIEGYLRSLVPDYQFFVKGIEEMAGAPIMLHAW